MKTRNPEAVNFESSRMAESLALERLTEKFKVTTSSGNQKREYGELSAAELAEKRIDAKRAVLLEKYLDTGVDSAGGSVYELLDKLVDGKLEAGAAVNKNILYRVYSILEDSQNEDFVLLKTRAYDYLEAESGTDKLAGITRGVNHMDGILGERSKKKFTGTKIAKAMRRRLKADENIEDVYARYEKKIKERGIDPDALLEAMTEYKVNYQFMLKTLEEQDRLIETKNELNKAQEEYKIFDNLRHKLEAGEINKSGLEKLQRYSKDEVEISMINKLLNLIDQQLVVQVKFGPLANPKLKQEYNKLSKAYSAGEMTIEEIKDLMIIDPKKKNEISLERGAAIALFWDIIDGAVDSFKGEESYIKAA